MGEQKFGYCGLNCEDCPVFIATVNNDDDLRQETAKEWSERYAQFLEKELRPEDMYCSGCKSEVGFLFIGCKKCPIRKCCKGKEYITCANCEEYEVCEILNGFFSVHPQAKDNLDRMRMSSYRKKESSGAM